MCDLCDQLGRVNRVYRDEPCEPFVVLSYGTPPSPTVVSRGHVSELTLSSAEAALVALRGIACRVYGSHFYLTTELAARGQPHWYVQSRRLSCDVTSTC